MSKSLSYKWELGLDWFPLHRSVRPPCICNSPQYYLLGNNVFWKRKKISFSCCTSNLRRCLSQSDYIDIIRIWFLTRKKGWLYLVSFHLYQSDGCIFHLLVWQLISPTVLLPRKEDTRGGKLNLVPHSLHKIQPTYTDLCFLAKWSHTCSHEAF